MASSTAPTTMAGSMPFSWLRSSMLWYKTLLAILCLLSRLSPGVRIRSANPRAGSVGFWRRDEARHLQIGGARCFGIKHCWPYFAYSLDCRPVFGFGVRIPGLVQLGFGEGMKLDTFRSEELDALV